MKTIYFQGKNENDLISRMHTCIYRKCWEPRGVAPLFRAIYERPLIYTVSKNLGDTKPGAPELSPDSCSAGSCEAVRAMELKAGSAELAANSCGALRAKSAEATSPGSWRLLTRARTELEGSLWRLTLLDAGSFRT